MDKIYFPTKLNLALTTDGIPELRDVIHDAASLITLYRDSPKVKRLVNLSDMGASTALRPLCPTRWTCSEGALESIVTNYVPLRESLLQPASDRTAPGQTSDRRQAASPVGWRILVLFHGISLVLHLLRMTTPGPEQFVNFSFRSVRFVRMKLQFSSMPYSPTTGCF